MPEGEGGDAGFARDMAEPGRGDSGGPLLPLDPGCDGAARAYSGMRLSVDFRDGGGGGSDAPRQQQE